MKSFRIAISILLCVSACLAYADVIGDASPYNIFTFDSLSYSNTSIAGAVVAGNSLTLTNMNTAIGVTPVGSNTGLVVYSGGTLDIENGSVNGSAEYATTLVRDTATKPAGATVTQAPSPFNFVFEQQYYQNLSNTLAALPVNGTVTQNGSTVTLSTTSTTAGQYVFDILNAETTANSLVINLPAGSTAIINFEGNASYNFGGFSLLNGLTAADILWNGPTAATVNVSGVQLLGTILAPQATVNLQNGTLNGQIISNNLVGASEQLSFTPFAGPLIPPAPDVPEPSTAAMAFAGLVLVAIGVVARKHSA